MAVLGELQAKNGTVDVKGKVSYASQEPWVFNGSLKYNITFGQEFNEAKYREVLRVCALERVSHVNHSWSNLKSKGAYLALKVRDSPILYTDMSNYCCSSGIFLDNVALNV